MTGAERISKERKRQLDEEKWSKTHDAQHKGHELAIAAACYAYPRELPGAWPWQRYWDKRMRRPIIRLTPTMTEAIDLRVRELEKAGALCAAEIDRLLRRKVEK